MTDGVGRSIRGSGILQRRKLAAGGWTAAMEDMFINELAVTANVRHALAQVGKSATSLYYRRRTRPDFALRWDRALSEAVVGIESDMMARALDAADVLPTNAPKGEPMSDATRLHLMAAHRKRVEAYRDNAEVRRADTEAIRKRILARVTRMARAMGLEVPE
jgi:hypothetical protein